MNPEDIIKQQLLNASLCLAKINERMDESGELDDAFLGSAQSALDGVSRSIANYRRAQREGGDDGRTLQ